MMAVTAASACPCPTLRVASPLRAAPARLPALAPQRASVTRTRPGATLPQRRPARAAVQTRAAMELFQLANEGAEISTAASVMFAITLVGLAVGFVLLRVEALVEEGDI